jgi:hypothetical protein
MRWILLILTCLPVAAETHVVRTPTELSAALKSLESGDVLMIGPGEYPGGHSIRGIQNLTVEALDPMTPPLFRGGTQAWQFSRCDGLTLRHLDCRGQTGNGVNIDDGGVRDRPVKGIRVEDLRVEDIGPRGNFDAIKCSGLQYLRIERCAISGWGGQAIDLVGCSEVLIRECRITGKEGFSQHTGPQFKGGANKIVIEKCTILDAGERPIQAGGSTGMDYFRPAGARYEAKDIIIRNNTIEGGTCATAFTGVDGAEFSGNTILRPSKWIFRILQETRVDGFAPCRNVRVSHNQITFKRAQVTNELNIGEGTAADTFHFEGNHWWAEDQPEASRPRLPVAEIDGRYGPPAKESRTN